jgi:hypothetical protein
LTIKTSFAVYYFSFRLKNKFRNISFPVCFGINYILCFLFLFLFVFNFLGFSFFAKNYFFQFKLNLIDNLYYRVIKNLNKYFFLNRITKYLMKNFFFTIITKRNNKKKNFTQINKQNKQEQKGEQNSNLNEF